jgi:hypothetical protein
MSTLDVVNAARNIMTTAVRGALGADDFQLNGLCVFETGMTARVCQPDGILIAYAFCKPDGSEIELDWYRSVL